MSIFEEVIEKHIEGTNYDKRIKDGMRYVLSGGKRLRPLLSLAVLKSLNKDISEVCLISEFIHCASLVIDDLHCFDNAKVRRNKQCIHLEVGEAQAYIISFTLLTEALLIAHDQLKVMKKYNSDKEVIDRYEKCIYNIIDNNSKAISGQLLSTKHLNVDKSMTKDEMIDMMHKKTSSFFDMALTTAFLVGQGDIDKLGLVHSLAEKLGVLYQMYDDYEDKDEDIKNGQYNFFDVGTIEDFYICKEEVLSLAKQLDLDLSFITEKQMI